MVFLADFWRAQNWSVKVVATEAAGHATELAREAANAEHHVVFAVGGDGTLGEVTNGLAGSETALAPLPAGTANSFASELRMPRPNFFNKQKLMAANESLANGRLYQMDLGYTYDARGNGRYWLLWTGTGADGFLVDWVEPRSKFLRRFGRGGYVAKGLLALPRVPSMTAKVEIDGRFYEGNYLQILISNCRRYGSVIDLSPQARLDDGLFEVWFLPGKHLPKLMQHLSLSLLSKHQKYGDMQMVNGRSVKIHTTPALPCQTDGDISGQTPLMCEIKPSALRLLVPDTAPADLFNEPGRPLLAG